MGPRALRLAELAQRVVACRACPRLVRHREEVARRKARAFRNETYWGKPVPGFGDPEAWLFLVGLAPAAHGANRTGRPFTGDGPRGAGDFLMAALHRAGLANRPFSRSADDGLALSGVYLSAICRCAPPQNRPTPAEVRNCLPFLVEELRIVRPRVVLCLGGLAFSWTLRALEALGEALPRPRPKFRHGLRLDLPAATLLASYHPSRQNTQTGRLTPAMLDAVLAEALQAQAPLPARRAEGGTPTGRRGTRGRSSRPRGGPRPEAGSGPPPS
ncbi:MAG: uracil-DNA glycosylase [Candidatus Bipolaricaulota bacterium]|nr:uracil-DNA glycosylase [Candidatus Bipolaricaulota bacterium]